MPTRTELEKIAGALRFPVKFFEANIQVAGSAGEVHFRKKSTTLAGQRKRAVGELNLCSLLAAELAAAIELPDDPLSYPKGRIRDFNDSPTFAAYSVRRHLNLPPGPIRNLTELAEAAGIFVFAFDMGEELQGLGHWSMDRPPVVCINSRMPGDRYRWTLAHELGHLALHSREKEPDTMEREANEFAAELLMPREDVYPYLRGVTIKKLRDLKHDWGVSMQALIWRARELGLMSDYERRQLSITFSKRGWRTKEPEPLAPEEVKLVPTLRREYASRLGGTKQLAGSLGLPEDLLARLTTVTRGPSRRHLRYVAGGDEAQEEA